MTTLSAWATPAWFNNSVLDHTWVTTYDNQIKPYPDIQSVLAADEQYWFCWGAFHAKGGTPVSHTGALGDQVGWLPLAKCLVEPNLPSNGNRPAQGTIFTYGIDGVCHQLSNQVLYATGNAGAAPLLVNSARGYAFSSLVYGDYGLQHAAWHAKRLGCGDTSIAQQPLPTQANWTEEAIPMAGPTAGPKDDFERRAQEVLAEDPDKLMELLRLRTEFQNFAALKRPGAGVPSAAVINARNQEFLNEVGRILGAERFERLFGFHLGQEANLVDPEIMRQQQLQQQ